MNIRNTGTGNETNYETKVAVSTAPMKKSYFSRQMIDGPLKFSSSPANSSNCSPGLTRKESAKIIRPGVLVGSASSKSIESGHSSGGKGLMFKSYIAKSGEHPPLPTKLSSFGSIVAPPHYPPCSNHG
jgi:hypothetical protein